MKKRNGKHIAGGISLGLILLLFMPTVQANVISFSGLVSDDDAPADYFDATIDYAYDSHSRQLTINVANLTTDPTYTISEIFFNVSCDVWGLTLLDNDGYNCMGIQYNRRAGGFGIFDVKLDLAIHGNNGLPSQQTAQFVLGVCGIPCLLDEDDFFVPEGCRYEAPAAIKFTQGSICDDSVYALPVVPEPTSLSLLGMGIAGLLVRRRFKRSQKDVQK